MPMTPASIQEIDLREYSKQNFRADTYLKSILSKLSEDDLRSYRAMLKDAKDSTAADLQRNVYRNYTEFVGISKEISSLEGDVLLLGDLFDQLASANNLKIIHRNDLASDDNIVKESETENAPESGSITKAPSNVFSSTELQEQQVRAMENMYETIEGLKKVLPVSKKRHIVRDASEYRMFEINPTTLKPKQQVYLIILSDVLLVTLKKKNILNGKTKMVIDKCFKLLDVAAVDIKDSMGTSISILHRMVAHTNRKPMIFSIESDLTNAFKIISHPDIYIYRTDVWEEKRSLLAAVKLVADDLIGQRPKEIEAVRVAKQLPKPQATANDPVGPAEKTNISIQTGSIAKAAKVPDGPELSAGESKWLSELSYDLDVLIAHREFDKAVSEIVKARQMMVGHKSMASTVYLDVELRADVLAGKICRDLANPIASKRHIRENIERLVALGIADRARDIFLESRTSVLRHRIKQVIFLNILLEILAYLVTLKACEI
ncbi:exocyst complex component exo84 [Entophlyctis sp. JEL0112]|nr:exocyst complex component exo84 [Entophlyctis sp. JEL0112]